MAVHVGLLTLELFIPEAHSLKEKRSVLKSMLEGIRGKFNVSAAEVEHMDLWQRATVAVTCVSNSQTFIDQVLNKVVDWVESNPRASLTDVRIEFL
jgi:uncharacterized protein